MLPPYKLVCHRDGTVSLMELHTGNKYHTIRRCKDAHDLASLVTHEVVNHLSSTIEYLEKDGEA